eukprot:3631818-Prymnesium_polylepis.1
MVTHSGVVNLAFCARTRPYPAGPVRSGVSANYVFDVFPSGVFICIGGLGCTCVLIKESLALLSLDPALGLHVMEDVPSVMSSAKIPPTA